LQINPDFYPAWYSRGVALSHLGDYEAALESYDRALQLKPDFLQAISRRKLALSQGCPPAIAPDQDQGQESSAFPDLPSNPDEPTTELQNPNQRATR
jgi:superkiller protein 3